jgi:hypothetical protein
MTRPLQGVRLGEQIQWYARVDAPAPVRDGRGLARRITAVFCHGGMDLSTRAGAPAAGWAGMPELAAAGRIREHGSRRIAKKAGCIIWLGLLDLRRHGAHRSVPGYLHHSCRIDIDVEWSPSS